MPTTTMLTPMNLTYETAKPMLFIKTINAETNDLTNIPHQRFEDLAFVPCLLLESGRIFKITIVSNAIARAWRITNANLFKAAWKNTLTLFPHKVNGLNNIVALMAEGKNFDNDESYMNPFVPTVVTNEKSFDGATVLFYPHIKQALGAKIGNYYALPSSIHEWIILPDNGTYDPADLADMVQSVNRTEVIPDDRLSDHVYYYNNANDTFAIVA